MPTVSVILPTYNRTDFLRLAIESVFAQTYGDWELIVADDGSGERTRGYLRSIAVPQVRTVWLDHCGNPSAVRNAAIAAACGRYLAFLDSDDVWAPAKLEKQLRALARRTRARWSYTNCRLVDARGRLLVDESLLTPCPPQGWILEPLLKLQVAICLPTVVAERELLQTIGGFDERQQCVAGQDLCLRLATKSEAVALPECLSAVRLHAAHHSAEKIGAQTGWIRLYEKMAELAPSEPLRPHCVRSRGETSLQLARYHGASDRHAADATTPRQALRSAWRHPHGWWGGLRRLLRAAAPRALWSALRRQVRGRAGSK